MKLFYTTEQIHVLLSINKEKHGANKQCFFITMEDPRGGYRLIQK